MWSLSVDFNSMPRSSDIIGSRRASPYCCTVSVHPSVHLCVCPGQLESHVCTQHCASRATSTTGLCFASVCLSVCLSVGLVKHENDFDEILWEKEGWDFVDDLFLWSCIFSNAGYSDRCYGSVVRPSVTLVYVTKAGGRNERPSDMHEHSRGQQVTVGDFTFWLDFRWANSLSESSV